MNASPELFSAMRAMEELRQVLDEETPHPVGSYAGDKVRERLIDRLEALGYETSIQDTMLCRSFESDWGVCSRVKNVLIQLDEQETGPAVLLMAHYDSQAGDIGATDDGSGVAALIETARAMKVHAPYAPHRISLRVREVAFLVAAAGACLVWFTYAFRFEAFFSFDLSPAITFPLGLAFSSLLPLLASLAPMHLKSRYWVLTAFMIVFVLAGIGVILPDYSETNPVRLPIIHLEDQDSKTAIWIAAAQSVTHESQPGSVPDPLQSHFNQARQVLPWSSMLALSASAEVTGRAGAKVDMLSDEISEGNRMVRLQVHVPQDAYRVELQVPIQNLSYIEVSGEKLQVIPRTLDTRYYRMDFYGYGSDGMEIRLVFRGSAVGEMFLVTRFIGLPASAEYLVKARPPSAVPGLDGDESVVYHRIN